jgi:hypothetical protein
MNAVKILSLIVSLVIFHCASSHLPRLPKTLYSGQDVSDEKSGLTVMADSQKQVIAVTNMYYHYGLILPYSATWEFSGDNEVCFMGSSNKTNVSLKIFPWDRTPLENIMELKARFTGEQAMPGLMSADTMTVNGTLILRTETDASKLGGPELSGVKQLSFFALKKWENIGYLLHLSRLREQSDPPVDEELFKKFMSAGFSVDFNR